MHWQKLLQAATVNEKSIWAIVIGLGMALSPIHNLQLTNAVTSESNVVEFFIPAFGTALWLMGSLGYITMNWERIDWGDKWVLIPLLVIVSSMGMTGFILNESWLDKVAPILMGMSLVAVYLAGRTLGVSIFRAFIPFIIIGVVIMAVLGVLNPGVSTGGMITNYCASAGFIIFGVAVNQGKWQWVLVSIAILGLFFIGALEAVFIVGILAVVVLARRDWSKRTFIVVGTLAGLVVFWGVLGYLSPLYIGNNNLWALFGLVKGEAPLDTNTARILTSGRWEIIVAALNDIRIIGHGYSLSTAGGGIVHNIPLIIMHQIGPVAAVAWTFATIYCVIKTKWKYAWVAVIAMCVWDHYLWTQFTPYWWALVGVSTASTIKTDLIFKEETWVS